jgi:hypothetical protein
MVRNIFILIFYLDFIEVVFFLLLFLFLYYNCF